jgi:hypothetical protein
MVILPNASKAVRPIEKLTLYSLNPDKDINKATAFRTGLGYTTSNAQQLVDNILQNIQGFEAVSDGNNGYGDIYAVVMCLTGENGKSANVLTSWIVENGTDYPKLTNVYVTKKKVGGE